MQRKTDYSDQKQHKQHKAQQNNKKKKKGRKKQFYGLFKRQTSEISHEKAWACPRNLQKEIESVLIEEQNKARRKNYIKAKID